MDSEMDKACSMHGRDEKNAFKILSESL